MDDIAVTPVQASDTKLNTVKLDAAKPKKTVADWTREMRMSADVNKTTTGVETDKVTPELLLATSRKLLGVARLEQQEDQKDSLEFQRFYGPAEYFAEHIQRDGGRLGRTLLWKATNKGSLDFMQPGALDAHVSDVFYNSKQAQMIDGSSPLETVDAAYKATRIGEGGVPDTQSAPDEMRTVQASYFGYLDPVRCYAPDTELMTETGWKRVTDITMDDKLACRIDGRLRFCNPTEIQTYEYSGRMYGYKDQYISYLVTPTHRMYTRAPQELEEEDYGYGIKSAAVVHDTQRVVDCALHLAALGAKEELAEELEKDGLADKVFEYYVFAQLIGCYLPEGTVGVDETCGCRCVTIPQMHDPSATLKQLDKCSRCLPFSIDSIRLHKDSVQIYSAGLCDYFEKLGSAADRRMPIWIFKAGSLVRSAFIRALFASGSDDPACISFQSKELAAAVELMLFGLGRSVRLEYDDASKMYTVRRFMVSDRLLSNENGRYFTQEYEGKVYCPTVPGGLVYCRRGSDSLGFWCGNSPESIRVGLDMYMTKHCMKGSDGKLYQKFINARTGKEEMVDSVTAAKSVIASPEMMEANTKSVFALGGKTGVRIVPKEAVDYYLPRADEAYSLSSNMVVMPSAVKEMRLLMGCLHPATPLVVINSKNEISVQCAKNISAKDQRIPGAAADGTSLCYELRNTVAKFPRNRKWFQKVVLKSGRTLITSRDHKWTILKDGKLLQVPAEKLNKGDIALRSAFRDLPNRRTFIRNIPINEDIAKMLGLICRSGDMPERDRLRFPVMPATLLPVQRAFDKLGLTATNQYTTPDGTFASVKDSGFIQWCCDNIGMQLSDRHVPSAIQSAHTKIAAAFLDAYTADTTLVGIDSSESIWILEIPNTIMRDELSLLFSRLQTDTLYRDSVRDGISLALKLVPYGDMYGDLIQDPVKCVLEAQTAPIMVDVDIDDNCFAAANGIVTHNSKYPLQAVSIKDRETPLVRGLDEASGKDMATVAGKYLGARFAQQDGTVLSVDDKKITVRYDDGKKAVIDLYRNFPMNAKGYIDNKPVVKPGQSFKEGDVLAASNYTDDNGVAAIGTNLKSAWLSWKGGTYEDAAVLSESAAKKLTSTTMYKTAIDLDKTISIGKHNYVTWKPSEYTNEQLANLDENGIIRPGSVLQKGDPMILAVQTSEPSPGTMGKRILTDLSEKWEHDSRGVVTDVVKTRNGVSVYATITAPAEVGDKIAGLFGNKCYSSDTEVLTQRGFVPFEELLETDKVAQVYKNGDAEFVKPIARQSFRYLGKMIVFRNDDVDICVTPDHRMAIARELNSCGISKYGLEICRASELLWQPAYIMTDVCIAGRDNNTEKLPSYVQLKPDDSYVIIYDGMVHCVTVNTGMIVVRRNGKQAVCGNCEIAQIIPDDQMPTDKDGTPLDVLWSPLGLVSRTNFAQIHEAMLAKIAKKTGKTEVVPAFFKGDLYKYVSDKLKQNGVTPDEDLVDPDTGRTIPHVITGYSYVHKLKHLAESKMSARGTDEYTCYDEDTDVLTEDGWKRWKDVTPKDRFWTCDDEGWFYAKASKLHRYKIKDMMLKIQSGDVDSLVTLGHDHLVAIDSNVYRETAFHKMKAADIEILDVFLLPQFGYTEKSAPADRVDAGMVKFAWAAGCIAASDVSIADDGQYVTPHTENERTVIKKALGDVDSILVEEADGWLHIHKGHFTESLIRDEMIRVPRSFMLRNELRVTFFSAYIAAAGAVCEDSGSGMCYTLHAKSGLCDDLMEQAQLSGFGSTVKDGKIIFNMTRKHALIKRSQASIGLRYYTGYVYCASIPSTGRLCVRRNGKVLISGNSEGIPGSGGYTGSKRFGSLEQGAMVGHDAFDNILDAKLIRGQNNADFWRAIRTGNVPTIPGEPLVHKKFFAHLMGSGINVRKTVQGISCFTMSNDDVKELTGPREQKTRDTYEAKSFRPINGGLFGQDIFGINGDRWAYIQLDEPLPNPVMEEPLARLLRMSNKDFVAVASGKATVQGMSNATDLKNRLASINLDTEAAKALNDFKNSTASKKDTALKRYVAIERMRRLGVSPDQYMLDRIPVIPPIFRPISTHNGLTMVADSNYLYAQLLDARDDMREAKNLPQEYQTAARENVYRMWKELTGLYDPENIKLKNKHVQGLLKWALGDSPKFSAFQRKIVGSAVDTVGRGVIVPNPRLLLNQIGIPKNMAFGIMAPFIEREFVKRGYTPIEAMKQVKQQTPQAQSILADVMKSHPVLMNRAPSLHKLSIMAFNPVMVAGHAIHVNPSIVVPFAADFDGDQVNIHVPVSDNARKEARERMFPERNLVSMKNRQILYKPEKEYQQGLYIATRMKQGKDVRPRIFRSIEEARAAHRAGTLDIDDPIIIEKP